MIVYVNETFVEEAKAVLQVGDLALQRGYAAFDFFRTKNGVPLFLDNYLDRFFHSAQALFLQHRYTKKELKEIIHQLVQQNGLQQSGIRMILTGGYSPDSYEPVLGNLVLIEQPLQLPSAEKFNAGIKVITHEYMRDLPAVKSINYLMGIWLQQKVREQKAADVLYHQQGWVSEFPRANVFVVTQDRKIVTPAAGILKGITRMKLMELLQDEMELEERALHLDEVKNAAEVFMTSTTKRILPINQVDDVMIGNGAVGPVTQHVHQQFVALEEQLINGNKNV